MKIVNTLTGRYLFIDMELFGAREPDPEKGFLGLSNALNPEHCIRITGMAGSGFFPNYWKEHPPYYDTPGMSLKTILQAHNLDAGKDYAIFELDAPHTNINARELAAILNDREAGGILSDSEEDLAAQNQLVVVYALNYEQLLVRGRVHRNLTVGDNVYFVLQEREGLADIIGETELEYEGTGALISLKRSGLRNNGLVEIVSQAPEAPFRIRCNGYPLGTGQVLDMRDIG
jgi:hypothetical protein